MGTGCGGDGGLSRWSLDGGFAVDPVAAAAECLAARGDRRAGRCGGGPSSARDPGPGVEHIGVGNFLGIGNIGNNNVGSGNTGDYNFGIGNIGNANLGNGNIGNANLGSGNAGFFNFGNGNDGNTNFGSGNAGFLNIGSGNEGSGNLGFGNAGDETRDGVIRATPTRAASTRGT